MKAAFLIICLLFLFVSGKPVTQNGDETMCATCETLVELFRGLWGSATIEDCSYELMIYVCTTMNVADHFVCQGLVSDFNETFKYVIKEVLKDPNEACGVVIKGCKGSFEIENATWFLPIPDGKPPPNNADDDDDAWREGATSIPIGCHKYVGMVKCKDGSKIQQTAIVELWENDIFDDLLHTQRLTRSSDLKTAAFSFKNCEDDGRILFIGPKHKYMEVYYIFKDVCHSGDEYTAETVIIETNGKTTKNVYVLDYKYAYLFYE